MLETSTKPFFEIPSTALDLHAMINSRSAAGAALIDLHFTSGAVPSVYVRTLCRTEEPEETRK